MAGAKIDLPKGELIAKALGIPIGQSGPRENGYFVTRTPLADGTVRFQANLIVREGVQIVLHSLILFNRPISPKLLARLLEALQEPMN